MQKAKRKSKWMMRTIVMTICCIVLFGFGGQSKTAQAMALPDPNGSIAVEYVDVGAKSVTLSTPGKMYVLYGTTTKNNVTVKGGTENNPIYVALNGVNMNLSGEKKSPLVFENDSYAQCWIAYDNGNLPSYAKGKANTLHGGSGYAGLHVLTNAAFVMRSKPGVTASVTCTGGSNGAGIGGKSGTSIRKWLEINVDAKVTVTANGGDNAAGIGGGDDGSVDHLYINGGTIYAHGGKDGAGIGGGDAEGVSSGTGGHCYGIEINNATVVADTKQNGAGIGAGKDKSAENIRITNSTISVYTPSGGAGIGGGYDGSATNVYIENSNVTALVEGNSAAIGGGSLHGASNITIIDSTVDASTGNGNNSGAAIGGGVGGDGVNIIIDNSKVRATAHDGAGIGGGGSGNIGQDIIQPSAISAKADNIQILNGSNVVARARLGAGIGSGQKGSECKNIIITDSIVRADSTYSAGVGSGHGSWGALSNVKITRSGVSGGSISGGAWSAVGNTGDARDITITDSQIDVKAAANGLAGIGGGEDSKTDNIYIKNSTVKAIGGYGAAGVGGGAIHGMGNIVGFANVYNINISGSTVTAQGNGGGAGIGGGASGDNGLISIDSSIITAHSVPDANYGGAGIGGGCLGSSDYVKIVDSTVFAWCGDGKNVGKYGAGIGSGGFNNLGTSLTQTEARSIYIGGNSVVDAHGGKGSAGIGAGEGSKMSGELSIYDTAAVTAYGGEGGAGIGGGMNGEANYGGDAHNINISGAAKVEAHGGYGGAGIGGGWGGDAQGISIKTSNDVKAWGGAGAAGIGAGSVSKYSGVFTPTPKKASDILIKNATVEAWPGANMMDGNTNNGSGAGIGGGSANGDFSNISIESGTVIAHSNGGSAGIGVGGGGSSSHGGGSIYIKGGHVQTDSLVVGTSFNSKRTASPGKAFISGGTVKVNWSPDNADDFPYYYIDGGSVNIADSTPARQTKNLAGEPVFRVRMKVPAAPGSDIAQLSMISVTPFGKTPIPYGTIGMQTNGSSLLYLYLTQTTTDSVRAEATVGATAYAGYVGTASSDNQGILKLPFAVTLSATPDLDALIAKSGVTSMVQIASPSMTEISDVAYVSSNANIAKVHPLSGVVTPIDFGTFTVTAKVTPADAAYYSTGTATITGNITKAVGSISIVEDSSKEYDAQVVNHPSVKTTNSGVVVYEYSGDGGATYVANPPVNEGNYKVRVSIAEDSKYTAASDVKDFVILPRQTTMAVSAVQDATNTNVTITVFNLEEAIDANDVTITNDNLTYFNPTSNRYDAASKTCTLEYTYTSLAAGEYTFVAHYSAAGNHNYLPCGARTTFDISKTSEPITVDAVGPFVYGNDSGFSLTVNDVAGRDLSVDVIEEFGFLTQGTVEQASGLNFNILNAGKVTLVVTAQSTDVYNEALAFVQVAVGRKNLTVTPILAGSSPGAPPADAQVIATRGYGASNPAFALHYDGLASGDTAESVSSSLTINGTPYKGSLNINTMADSVSNVGVYDVTVNKEGLFVPRNYNITYQTAKIDVTPIAAKVIAEDNNSVYGHAIQNLTYRYDGLKNGDHEADFGTPSITTTATNTSDAGTYPITLDVGMLVSNNYIFSKEDAAYTIEKAFTNVQIDCDGKIYDQTPVAPQVVTNTGGQDVHYIFRSIEDGRPMALEQFSKMPPTDAGAYAVVGVVAPGTNYMAAYTAPVPFHIIKAYPFAQIEQSRPQIGTVTFTKGQPLGIVSLPEGWNWFSPERSLIEGSVKAFAVFTPADTHNYTRGGAVIEFDAVGQEVPSDNKDEASDASGADATKAAPPTGDSGPPLRELLVCVLLCAGVIAAFVFAYKKEKTAKRRRS